MSSAAKTTAADETKGKKPKVKKVTNGSPTNGVVIKTPRKRANKKAVEAKEEGKQDPKAAIIVAPVIDQRRGLAARIDAIIVAMMVIATIKKPLQKLVGTNAFWHKVQMGIKVEGLDAANIANLLGAAKLPSKVKDAVESIAATQEEKMPTCKRVHTAVGVLHDALSDGVKKPLLEYYALRGITPPEEKLYDTLRYDHLGQGCVEMHREWRQMSKVLDPERPRAEMKKDEFRLMSVVELDEWSNKLQSKLDEMRPLHAAKIKADKERKDGELAAARKRQSDEQRAENEERDGLVMGLLYAFKRIPFLHNKLGRDLPGTTGKIGTDFLAPIATLRVEAQRFKDWKDALEAEWDEKDPKQVARRAAKQALSDETARVHAARVAGEEAKDATIRAAEKAARGEAEKRRNLIRQSERLGVSAVKLAAAINVQLGQGTVQAPARIELRVSTAVLEESVQMLAATVQDFEMVLDYGLIDPKPMYWIEPPQDRVKRLRLIQEAKPIQWRIRHACSILKEVVPDVVETGYFDLALVEFTDWLTGLNGLLPSVQQRAKKFHLQVEARKKKQSQWDDEDLVAWDKYKAGLAEFMRQASAPFTDARGVIEADGKRVNTTAGNVINHVADLAPPDIDAP